MSSREIVTMKSSIKLLPTSLPISITGEVDAKELDIDINITNVPALNTLKVEFEGTK